jgi:hypothetical protein
LPPRSVWIAHAAELEGFKFDDKAKLGNAELVVNGTGVRSKFGKRYAMALYLPAKATTDAKAALAAKGSRSASTSGPDQGRLRRHLRQRRQRRHQRQQLGCRKGCAEGPRVKQLADTVNALGEIKAGTGIVFDWVPERGMVLTVGGKPAGQPIPGEDFYTALLRVWLGEDPAQGNLKEALLGKPQ